MAVHVFTASGAVLGFLAIISIFNNDLIGAFLWLGLALLIDGLDGSLARKIGVTDKTPNIDGSALDLVIDYLNYVIIQNGGWHFSTLKLPRDIIKKINSFCHGEFNKQEFKNEKLILQKINDLQDIFNRDIIYKKVEINDSYPEYLIDNIDNYKEWII